MSTSPVLVETKTGSQLTHSGISGLGWAALLWVLLVMPIWSAHFPELMPGLRELEATGSRTAWLEFWLFSAARAWFGFFLCLWALKREGYTVEEIKLTPFLPRFYR